MNNYKYLIIFVQKIESLTANSIFHQLVWWRHQWWRHPISVKRCLHYRGTVGQKHLAIGRGVKILDQKYRGGGVNEHPPASLRVIYSELFDSAIVQYSWIFATQHNTAKHIVGGEGGEGPYKNGGNARK